MPPAKFVFDDDDRRSTAVDSLIAGGCIISGATVKRSLLFSSVNVHSWAQVEDSVILPGVEVGRHAVLKRCVVDKRCRIPPGMVIGEDPVEDRKRFFVSPKGITLVTAEMLGQGANHFKKSVKANGSQSVPNTTSSGPIDWSTQSDAMLRQNSAPRDLNAVPSKPVIDTLTVDSLTAIEPTTLPKDAKVHDVKLVLGGDMERYVWHINGKAIQQDRLLYINKGEVIRFTFVNDTMMHHPMHFHGHFFRVINANGEKSPLKHTVDVPPHSSRTIEFYSNEPGQWMLHCHNLYKR